MANSGTVYNQLGSMLGWSKPSYSTNTSNPQVNSYNSVAQITGAKPIQSMPSVKGSSTSNSGGGNSGGGGSSSGGNSGGGYTGGGGYSTPGIQGPDPAAIDAAYAEAEGYINEMLNKANSDMAEGSDYMKAFSSPYESQKPTVETQATSQLNTNQLEGENAITSATRLYNELAKGGIQKFGGGDSAARFYQGQLGNELQRNIGQVRQTVLQNVQKIGEWKSTQLNNIQTNISNALLQARQALQSRIDAINSSKVALAQDKAAAKLSELQNYRSTVNQIVMYQNQLENQVKQTALQNITSIANSIGQGASTKSANALDLAYSTYNNPSSAIVPVNLPTGQVSYNKENKYQYA